MTNFTYNGLEKYIVRVDQWKMSLCLIPNAKGKPQLREVEWGDKTNSKRASCEYQLAEVTVHITRLHRTGVAKYS